MTRGSVTAVIGDMVRSRSLSVQLRGRVQTRFSALMRELNRRFARSLRAKFVITLGDEFQALINDATLLPSILFQIEQSFRDLPIRTGIGFGTLTTTVGEYAINVDGPALHRAREAINLSRRRRALGGIFKGFGDFDPILNGFARLTHAHRARMTDRQLAVATLLRK